MGHGSGLAIFNFFFLPLFSLALWGGLTISKGHRGSLAIARPTKGVAPLAKMGGGRTPHWLKFGPKGWLEPPLHISFSFLFFFKFFFKKFQLFLN
jgi:hypothetical protein